MRNLLTLFAIGLFAVPAVRAADTPLPKGDVLHFTFERSTVFPGTFRDYWVYVPKQYDPAKPACLYVGQDGIQFNAPAVFDQLIDSKEMPVTIGVFIMHGRVRATSPDALDRFNRSYEYDGLGDNYARFLLDELLPDVEKKTTADGRPIHLSKNAADRCIAGASSGAICAFTAAWERPDSFSRIFSAIGTFVGLRGGNNYPTLIRKYEPKPIRVFLQDGSADQNIYGGDWWMANQEMERALTFAGYEVNHVWGAGGHSGAQGTEIFPDVMRWLWKGWPAPVPAGGGSPQLRDILIPGNGWQLVGEGFGNVGAMASNILGEVYFTDEQKRVGHKVDLAGKIGPAPSGTGGAIAAAFGPDGALYAPNAAEALNVTEAGGHSRTLARGMRARDLVVRHDGRAYVVAAGERDGMGQVWLIDSRGRKTLVDTGPYEASGVTLSPDQSLLYVADGRSHWVYSFQIQPDGTLRYGQQYYDLHVPDTADDSGAAGMCVDQAGRLYVATRMGVQVCDQAGRVNCIIPVPTGRVTGLCFGGANHNILFAACGDRVYMRQVKVKGALAFEAPIKPAPPQL